MPAGYSSRCKACNSHLRGQIEAWKVKDKLNTSQIELKLKDMGEPISRRALDNHFAEHYDVKAEVREQYNKSQVALERDAGELLTEIQILDDVVAGKHHLHQTLEKILSNRLKGLGEDEEGLTELPKLPLAYVSLYNGCAGEIRQCLKTKQELLGEDGNTKAAESFLELIELAESRSSSDNS